uniref:hypothetical protein n=1 Tax=Actinomadura sp. CA-154981 TaxID=3240037 RepID=UPI003F496A17
MADAIEVLSRVQPGRMSCEEGLAALEELWGPPQDTPEQARADAWARRATGQPKQPGDDRLLAEADADIAAKYGRSVRRAS